MKKQNSIFYILALSAISCSQSAETDTVQRSPEINIPIKDSTNLGVADSSINYLRRHNTKNTLDSLKALINPYYYFGTAFENDVNSKSSDKGRYWRNVFAVQLFLFEEQSLNLTNSNSLRVSKYSLYDHDFVVFSISETDSNIYYTLKQPAEGVFDKPVEHFFEIQKTEFDTVLFSFANTLKDLPPYYNTAECCDGWMYLFEVNSGNKYLSSCVYEPFEIDSYKAMINSFSILDQYTTDIE